MFLPRGSCSSKIKIYGSLLMDLAYTREWSVRWGIALLLFCISKAGRRYQWDRMHSQGPRFTFGFIKA